MRTMLLSLLLLVSTSLLLPAQNEKPEVGVKHPRFIELSEKLNRGQAMKAFRETFNLKNKDIVLLKKSYSDELDFTHEVYQQYYDDVKVEGGVYSLHIKNGKIWYMSGEFFDIFKDVNTTPSISEEAAFAKALQQVGAQHYTWEDGGGRPQGELVILADSYGREEPRLAYKFDIYATEPLSRANVFIDAHANRFLGAHDVIHNTDVPCSGPSLYNGTVSFTGDYTGSNYRLRQTSDGNGIETYSLNNGTNYNNATDVTSNTSNFTNDATAVQAHWGAEQTHKYYYQTHGRNSFNGSGAVIRSYVHYSSNYVNAFWDGQRMTYGDGDGISYGPLVSLDIVGHEITHGVTSYSANLVYSYESGALNESFSDIFGEAIENYSTGSNNWQMGTDIGIGGSGAIRSMNNPNAFGDPDTYLGTNWYTGTGDNGGVHINSGVQNKWFYILSQGESGTNDIGSSYSVTGIGIDKAAAIAYRNLTVYLGTNSQYYDARTGAIQSAIDLYGAGSAEEIATTNAWYAVGVGGAYGTLSYCTSQGNNSSYEWIASVNLGSFTNNSGAAGYSDFTSQTVNVDEGQTYSLSLTPGFSGTVYNEYWKIWIDYNADGDFSDAGELAFDAGALSSSTVSGSISIPAGLSGTTTRMRVSMKWNASQTECESFSYGEVEDYTIAIGGGGGTPTCDTPTGLAVTSVGTTTASIDWNDVSGAVDYTVRWREVGTSTWSSGPVATSGANFTGLAEGTTYETQVSANCSGGSSAYTSSVTFTTDVTAPTCSTPTGLTVTAVGTTTASIDWADVSGAVDYTVRWREVGTSTWSSGTVGTSGGQFTGLTEGTTYETQVNTNCSGSSSGFTSSVTFTTDTSSPGGCSQVDANDFESGWGIWNDGGSDARRSANDAAYSNGTYSIRLRDNTSSSTMTTNNIDLSAYDYITVDFSYYALSMENGEDFWLQISNNGGSSYSTEASWASGAEFQNGQRYNEQVTLAGPFASNARLRFRCDASGNSDYVYIDDVVITGCTNTAATNKAIVQNLSELKNSRAMVSLPVNRGGVESSGVQMNLFPNPVSNELNIRYHIPVSDNQVQLIVTDLNGRTVQQKTLAGDIPDQQIRLDVSNLSNGFYFVHLISNDTRLSKKFIVQNR